MPLALFDLDNTLLAGDSDYLWGQYLVEKHIVDGVNYERRNQEFYEIYKLGTMDIHEFLEFQLAPLAKFPYSLLQTWHTEYINQKILPIVLPKAQELIRKKRQEGFHPLIITATNSFITRPIAALFGIDDLIATEPEFLNGQFTGKVTGIPCYREGKVTRIMEWINTHQASLDNSWFYSDSHNDLPLLNQVSHPVAVNPDAILEAHAKKQGWPIMDLR